MIVYRVLAWPVTFIAAPKQSDASWLRPGILKVRLLLLRIYGYTSAGDQTFYLACLSPKISLFVSGRPYVVSGTIALWLFTHFFAGGTARDC